MDSEKVVVMSGVGVVNRLQAAQLADLARRHLVAARISAPRELRKKISVNSATRQASWMAKAMRDWSDGTKPKPASQIIKVGDPAATIAAMLNLMRLQRDVASVDMLSDKNDTAAVFNYLSALAAIAALSEIAKECSAAHSQIGAM